MASYSLAFRPSVEKDLASLPKHVVSRILDRFEKLKSDPFSATSRKLQGAEQLYRVRVGDYRIVYEPRNPGQVYFAGREGASGVAHWVGAA